MGGSDGARREGGADGKERGDAAEDPLELGEEGRKLGNVGEGVDPANRRADAAVWCVSSERRRGDGKDAQRAGSGDVVVELRDRRVSHNVSCSKAFDEHSCRRAAS